MPKYRIYYREVIEYVDDVEADSEEEAVAILEEELGEGYRGGSYDGYTDIEEVREV